MTVDVEGFEAPIERRCERFVLRCYRPDEGPALAAAVNASYEHLRTFMPWATDSQTDAEATELIETFIAQYAALENFVMSIWSPDESTLLGGCGFHLREGPLSTRSVESGMWIRSDAAGQGLGSAVLLELITWGFTEWPWLRIAWKCNTTNTASIRCAEKAGLVWEGTLRGQFDEATGGRRDTACYAILKGA